MSTRTSVLLASASVAVLALLSGCGEQTTESEIGTIRTAPPQASAPELPPVEPVTQADCPYLSTEEVAGLGAGSITDVRIDESVDPVACFFYDEDRAVALTTTVYTVDSADRATELVQESAPAETAETLTVEDGWAGGSTEGPGGSLVVLSREDRLLAVQTVGEEADPAREIAQVVAPRVAG
ncbi:MAG: DUF2020 domain-containing protein [Actinomycetales bacterium]|nr:DUF2020 domain-containing protein [Actinomycetales bacterium]